MLFVFDLDDTLINTFECITLFAYKSLLKEIKDREIKDLSLHKAFTEIKEIRRVCLSSRKTLQIFFQKHAIPTPWEWAFDFVQTFEGYDAITLNQGVSDCLSVIRGNTCAIVTKGIAKRQRKKIDRSSLHKFNFARIVVVESGSKENAYHSIIKEFKPEKSILIADRKDDFVGTQGLFSQRVLFTPPYFSVAKPDFLVDLQLSNLKDLSAMLSSKDQNRKR